jgi:hypothetical protein
LVPAGPGDLTKFGDGGAEIVGDVHCLSIPHFAKATLGVVPIAIGTKKESCDPCQALYRGKSGLARGDVDITCSILGEIWLGFCDIF